MMLSLCDILMMDVALVSRKANVLSDSEDIIVKLGMREQEVQCDIRRSDELCHGII